MSVGREVEFLFAEEAGVWVLHTNNLETPDPYDGRLIRSWPEVVRADGHLVLLRIRTKHSNFPIDYFVCSFPPPTSAAGQPGRPSVVRLPDVAPEMASARSVGILRAPLRFPMLGWHTDIVIPFDGSLIWIDLWRGLLRCPNLLPGGSSVRFEYVALPPELLPARNADDVDDQRSRKRSGPFRSIGCCNGDVKLVNLSTRYDPSVAIWTLTSRPHGGGCSWSNKTIVHIHYPSRMMRRRHDPLPPLGDKNTLCFPVLSTHNLYLTLAGGNESWLLQIDLHTGCE